MAAPKHEFNEARYSDDIIIDELTTAPGEVALIAIGPLTNLAAAERKKPGTRVLVTFFYGLLLHERQLCPAAKHLPHQRVNCRCGLAVDMTSLGNMLARLESDHSMGAVKVSISIPVAFLGKHSPAEPLGAPHRDSPRALEVGQQTPCN